MSINKRLVRVSAVALFAVLAVGTNAAAAAGSEPLVQSASSAAQQLGPYAGAPEVVVDATNLGAYVQPAHVSARALKEAITTAARSGEGVIRITIRVCGTSNNWQAVAAANNIRSSTGYFVALGQLVRVDCNATASAPQAAAPAPQQSGWTHPLPGRCGGGYGMRFHPILHVWRMHYGDDLGAPTGTVVHAIAAGTVISAGYNGGAGNQVIIDHGNGVRSKYNHLSYINIWSGHVNAGTHIGSVGATGLATGPHLHIEIVVNGSNVDPAPFLSQRGVRLAC